MWKCTLNFYICVAFLAAFPAVAGAVELLADGGKNMPPAASIAGGGVLWLSLMTGAAVVLVLRRKRR